MNQKSLHPIRSRVQYVILKLKTVHNWVHSCTDENAVFRCDSNKNSLVIICLYLKVHSLKIC